jgi:hypothetical protein
MIIPNNTSNKPFYGFSKLLDHKKLNTEPSEPITKKRRESIDLGITGRSDNNEMLPFMRRVAQNETKV